MEISPKLTRRGFLQLTAIALAHKIKLGNTNILLSFANYKEYDGTNGYGQVGISGLPNEVQTNTLPSKANDGADRSGTDHKNTLPDKFAYYMIANPGVFMNEGFYIDESGEITLKAAQEDIDRGVARNLHNPDFHRVLQEGDLLPVQEGEFDLITGAGGTFVMKGVGQGRADVVITAKPIKGHTYMIIVRNSLEDGQPDVDSSFDVICTNIHGGSTKGVRYPRGLFMSQTNFEQNLEAAHSVNGGNDGVTKVTIIVVDPRRGTMSMAHSQKGTNLTDIITNLT